MELGFIKLHRKLKNNEIMYKEGILQLFIYLLLTANYKENIWCGITIKPGQLVTGKYRLAETLKTNPSTIYKRLQWLKNRNMIGIKSNHHFSIISICNWETYQVDEIKEELQGNYKVTTKELQGNTLKEVKNVRKKEKDKIKHKYGDYKHVLLTDEEKEKLKNKFGREGTIKKIQQMDEGIELKGYKYKSHYLAILKWAKNENRTIKNALSFGERRKNREQRSI